MSTKSVKTNKAQTIKWAITIVLTVCMLFIPVNDTFTTTMRTFLAITVFAIAIMGFELMETLIISVLLPVLYMVFVAPADVVYSGWLANTPWVCIGALLLANMLIRVGVLNRISYWIISKCGTYRMTVYGVMTLSIVISFLTNSMAGILLCAFAYGVCKSLGLQKSKESAILMMVSVLGGATIQLCVYKPMFMTIINGMVAEVMPGFAIQYLEMLIANWPVIIMLYVVTEVFLRVFKVDVKTNLGDEYKRKLAELGPMSSDEKKGTILAIITLIYALSCTFTGLSIDYGFMLIPLIGYLPIIKIGKKEDITAIPFDMLFFVMACMAIGTVATSCGLAAVVSNAFMTSIAPLGKAAGMGAVYVFGIVANFLMTPLAMLAAFSAPIAQIAQGMGLNPDALLYIFYAACDQVIFPYEYVSYLLAFSFGMMSMKDFISLAVVKLIVTTIFIFTILLGWWAIIGIL